MLTRILCNSVVDLLTAHRLSLRTDDPSQVSLRVSYSLLEHFELRLLQLSQQRMRVDFAFLDDLDGSDLLADYVNCFNNFSKGTFTHETKNLPLPITV